MVGLLKWWREMLIALLIIAVLVSANTCSSKNDDIDLLTAARDSIIMYRSKTDQLVSQVATQELTIVQVKDYSAQLGIDKQKLIDQVGKLNNLVGYWKGKASMADTVYIPTIDTVFIENGIEVTAKTFKWNNKYLYVNGLINGDKTRFSYDYTFGFEMTTYRNRHGFLGLGKSQLVTDLTFSDPNIQTTAFKGIVIKEPPKMFYETQWFAAVVSFFAGIFISK